MTNQPLTFAIPEGFGEPETDAQFALGVAGWARASGDERCDHCTGGLTVGEPYWQRPDDRAQHDVVCRSCAPELGEPVPPGAYAVS